MVRLRQGFGDVNSVIAQPSVDGKICDGLGQGDSDCRFSELYLDNLAQSGKFRLGKIQRQSYAVLHCLQHRLQFYIKSATRTGNPWLINGLFGRCSALSC